MKTKRKKYDHKLMKTQPEIGLNEDYGMFGVTLEGNFTSCSGDRKAEIATLKKMIVDSFPKKDRKRMNRIIDIIEKNNGKFYFRRPKEIK